MCERRKGGSAALFKQEQRARRVLDRLLAHEGEFLAENCEAVVQRDVVKQINSEFYQPAEHDVIGRNKF